MRLLRLNYLGGQGRYASFRSRRPPAWVWPLPARPGFTADGGADGTDYGILVWMAEPTPPGGTRLWHLDNRTIENRWSQGTKERPDPRYPDPRSVPTPQTAKVSANETLAEWAAEILPPRRV